MFVCLLPAFYLSPYLSSPFTSLRAAFSPCVQHFDLGELEIRKLRELEVRKCRENLKAEEEKSKEEGRGTHAIRGVGYVPAEELSAPSRAGLRSSL